jgi:hypothetical protein
MVGYGKNGRKGRLKESKEEKCIDKNESKHS